MNTRKDEAVSDNKIEPIRGSIAMLIFRLFLIMFLIDTLYSVLNYYIFQSSLFQNIHPLLIVGVFIAHFAKNIIEIYFVLAVVINWASKTFYLSDKHIVERSGIINVKEKIYDLKIVRSVQISQGLLGKLCNYGDIVINTSSIGGYSEKIYLTGISKPEEYEELLKHCIDQSSYNLQ